ncbi:MAG: hypothetical protein MJ077_04245 [Oscillospiraceae bacterium]|nr:hypothetical protein [Oscillospiraceae bacterium]
MIDPVGMTISIVLIAIGVFFIGLIVLAVLASIYDFITDSQTYGFYNNGGAEYPPLIF